MSTECFCYRRKEKRKEESVSVIGGKEGGGVEEEKGLPSQFSYFSLMNLTRREERGM